MSWLLDLLASLFTRPEPAPKAPTSNARNRIAWLDTIAACEGTAAPDGYGYLFGSTATNGIRFTDFSQHPNIRRQYIDKSGDSIITTAAGRYQINFPTYNEFGGGSFYALSQDRIALSITERCGALADVDAGRLQAAIDKCAGRWASLPSSKVAQPHRSYAYAEAAFKRSGGVVAS